MYNKGRDAQPLSDGDARQVNNLLSRLRGEQYRHTQNVTGKRSIALPSLPSTSHNKPTLPLNQIFSGATTHARDWDAIERESTIPAVQPAPFRRPGEPGHRPRQPPPPPPVTLVEGVPTYAYPNGAVPGPKPPRSWSALFDKEERNTVEWRREALGLVFERSALDTDARTSGYDYGDGDADLVRRVQPLTMLCMRVLMQAASTPEELAELAQYVTPYIRKRFVRWCAVDNPLPSGKLFASYAGEGHADGEILVVGPQASIRADAIAGARRKGKERAIRGYAGEGDVQEGEIDPEQGGVDDWDAQLPDDPTPLLSLIVLNTPMSMPTLFALPPTLTHLALIALPQPLPVHRLPGLCPLLEILDLSYNPWLSDSSSPLEDTLDRTEWRRWRRLRLLGLRGCGVPVGIIKKVNEGRWEDVDIVGLEHVAVASTSIPIQAVT